MAKPFQLTPPGPSIRRASPSYTSPSVHAPSGSFIWTPGIEQNQAPQGDEPLPNLPQAPTVKPYRLR